MPDDQRTRPTLPVDPHTEAQFPVPLKQSQPGTDLRIERPEDQPPPAEALPDSINAKDYELIESPERKWQILVRAFELNRRALLNIPGATAVDIGYKHSRGSFTNELAIRLHVERKLPEEAKDTYFKNREFYYIPRRGDEITKGQKYKYFRLKKYEVPLDVIEGDYRPTQLAEPPRPGMVLQIPQESEQVNRRRRLDPLVGGISIGGPQAPAGTLGALVWDNTDGSVCILSNWHVLSGDPRAEAGTPCFQPGRLDHGRASDEVACLKRWSFDSQTDAAIAELTGVRHYCAGEILSLYQQITGEKPPHLGMLVQKVGRSTGFTWGFVDGLYFTSTIEYNNGIVQTFEDQIHIALRGPDPYCADTTG